ncbi:hypothetical protein C9994_10380 [Marivirga lumbricoides]|uniref:DNA-binding response regulator n=1 Tax=Marivirga lumbricoides TaxID=1046115 RepID=A0A2T4DPT7_9BACT|nr:hypothetical protein C9994_10380 [Marivirga lumbricoides]
MKVLIVEDEKLNAEHLVYHIELYGDMEVLGVLSSNEELITWFNKNIVPDLIFSDIQLLDGPVFLSLGKINISCPIIFTTAYDTYYQDAFDVNGIAYLLKPVSYTRFSTAMDKFKLLKNSSADINWQVIAEMLNKKEEPVKERVLVKSGNGMILLEMKSVKLIYTHEGKCTAIDAENNFYEFRYKIADLAKELDSKKFFQINRGEIVNIDYIQQIEPFFNDRLSISLKNYKQHVLTSTSNTSSFRKWLEQ